MRFRPVFIQLHRFHYPSSPIMARPIFRAITIQPHGNEDIYGAFANSCNCAFCTIGINLNIGALQILRKDLFFNTSLPTEIPHQKAGFYGPYSVRMADRRHIHGSGRHHNDPAARGNDCQRYCQWRKYDEAIFSRAG